MKILQTIKSKRGVTLIELLVVVVILGIIAAVAIPLVSSNQEDTYKNTNRQNLKIVNEAVQRYAIDHGGSYPVDNTNANQIDFSKLINSTDANGDITGTDFGPYLQEVPTVYGPNGATITGTWTISDGKVSLPAGAVQ